MELELKKPEQQFAQPESSPVDLTSQGSGKAMMLTFTVIVVIILIAGAGLTYYYLQKNSDEDLVANSREREVEIIEVVSGSEELDEISDELNTEEDLDTEISALEETSDF